MGDIGGVGEQKKLEGNRKGRWAKEQGAGW